MRYFFKLICLVWVIFSGFLILDAYFIGTTIFKWITMIVFILSFTLFFFTFKKENNEP